MFRCLALACSFALLPFGLNPSFAGAQSSVGETAPVRAKVRPIVYANRQYGFSFELPPSWIGYTVVMDRWEGQRGGDAGPSETGPKIVLRDRRWTASKPYQDIPIMVFTKAQWKVVASEGVIVSAAPTDPERIGGSRGYVFALPPRYVGFTEAQGQQAVVDWMRGNHLYAF